LGNVNAQWKLGLRVTDLRAKLTASGTLQTTSAVVGVFSTQQNATFVGAGPRLGVEGSTPLGGGWSIDWLAGAAVLFGERHSSQLQFSSVPTPNTTGQIISDTPAVFNVDAQAGLSYWFSPNLKITASYRVDAYFNALKTIKTGTANRKLHKRGSGLQRSDAAADIELLIEAASRSSFLGEASRLPFFFCVMAALVPAIHVLPEDLRRGCPRQARA